MTYKSKSKMFSIQKTVIAALCIAVGVILPRVFHVFPAIMLTFPNLNPGMVFLPMHIPVLLCGIICGFPYGVICGISVPIISHFMTGGIMPPSIFLPSMICELAVYGLFAGLLMYLPIKSYYKKMYVALTGSMLLGRIVYGITQALLFDVGNYSTEIWVTTVFIMAIPGIAIQFAVIPPVITALRINLRNL
ncbi:MAG: ECF transporter S component [Oscillospiraceae bacterium]|nr:ECF transporter S component [Oscillospiraceae bacterium]